MDDEFLKVMAEIDQLHEKMAPLLPKIAAARRAFAKSGSDADRDVMIALEQEAGILDKEAGRLIEQLGAATGLSAEELEEVQRLDERLPASAAELIRENLTIEHIAPTASINEALPAALEQILRLLPKGWLDEQPGEGARIDDLAAPDAYLSLTKGIRRETEAHRINRLRQAIYVGQDFLESRPFYDHFAGALLTSTLARMARQADYLHEVGGERDKRIEHLWRGPSKQVDATFFELLTAAACVEKGRSVEFLSATHEKTPDIRAHDPFPILIECKRQEAVSQYEAAEDDVMRRIFVSLRAQARQMGLYGTFELELTEEASLVEADDVVRCLLSQRLMLDPSKPRHYSWGRVALAPHQRRVSLPDQTPIYSPDMLEYLFGWTSDLPEWDGICCSIDARGEPRVDQASEPIGLLWRNNADNALKKRSKAPMNLFSKASMQIHPGEFGIIYVNYLEGARAEIADMRVVAYQERLREFEHSDKIRIPISVLSRIYPRPLEHGLPDLIEGNVQYLSHLYGDRELFDFFPTMIFTHPTRPD